MTIQFNAPLSPYSGHIRNIVEGPLVSKIDVDTCSGIVSSVIATRAVKEMQLTVGLEIIAYAQAREVCFARL